MPDPFRMCVTRSRMLALNNGLLAFFALSGDFRSLDSQLLFGQGVTGCRPGMFFSRAEILHPPGRPLVQKAAICAVQIAPAFIDDRNAVNMTIHDRFFTAQVQAKLFQSPGKLFLRRHGDFRLRRSGLFRQPGGELAQVSAFRRVPKLVVLVPLGSQLLGLFLFFVRHGQEGFFFGRVGRNAHRGNTFIALHIPFRPLHRLFLRQFLFHFQSQDVFFDLLRIAAGADDFIRIILQRLDPGVHIGGVVLRIMRDADVLAEHPGGDFRPQFLAGIHFRTEWPVFPIQAAGVARPVAEFMQGCAVVEAGILKVFTRRQMDGVCAVTVKGPVALVVVDVRAGGGKDVFRLFHRLPFEGFVREFQGRHSFNLLRVEDVGKAHDRLVQFHSHFFRLAVFAENGFTVFAQAILLFAELKINHGRGLAAGDDAHVFFVGLAQGHPARIVIAGSCLGRPCRKPGCVARQWFCPDARAVARARFLPSGAR